MDKIRISEVKEKVINDEWNSSVYSDFLKMLDDELYYTLRDYGLNKCKKYIEDEESNIGIYLNQIERAKDDYLFELKEEETWIKFIPCIYSHIVEAYKKDLFRLKFEVKERVIYISLKVNPDKIDDFLKYITDNYRDVGAEDILLEDKDNDYDYIDQAVYELLDIVADAIGYWDKRYR